MRLSWRVAVVALLTMSGVGLACANSDKYVYTARRINADGGCLEAYKGIDLVNGDTVSSVCEPTCFRYGDDTFTSKMCPPLPDLAIGLDAESPECKAASELYGTTCGADAAPPAEGDDDDDVALDAGDGGG